MDECDRASEREEQHRRDAIMAAARAQNAMPPTGRCYNCNDVVGIDEKFCDVWCRTDYERRKQAEIRRGLA